MPDLPSPHLTEIGSVALSPDGRLLATGSVYGRGYGDGHLVLWDVAAGRPIRVHTVAGGVGWPDEPAMLQWRPDGQALGLAFDTNAVGVIDPLREGAEIQPQLYVTNGWPSPPAWTWSPDGSQIYIACWGPAWAYGAYIDLRAPTPQPRWTFSAPYDPDEEDVPALEPLRGLRWRVPGLVTGWTSPFELVGLDPIQHQLLWTRKVRRPASYGADGAPELGRDWFGRGVDALVPSPDGRRLAALVPQDAEGRLTPGVHLHGDDKKPVLPADLPDHDEDHDAPAFAWSPDGQRGALLRRDGVVELWELAGAPRRLVEVPAEGITGLYYGEALALVGPERLVFLQPDGDEIASYTQGTEEA